MHPDRRHLFLSTYLTCRTSGDTTALEQFLSADLVLEDPQLPGGSADRAGFLELVRGLAASVPDLALEPYGPLCGSEDGTTFTQRWFAEGGLAEDPEARVSIETLEMFVAPGEVVERVTIFVRDLTQSGGAIRPQPRSET